MTRIKQEIIEGVIIRIDISESRMVFGRLFSMDIGFYDFVVSQNSILPLLEDVIQKNIFCYCAIYDSIITRGLFKIIGNIPLTEKEKDNVPPKFHQKITNDKDCSIFWADGRKHKASVSECVDIQPNAMWGLVDLKKRIEDYFS